MNTEKRWYGLEDLERRYGALTLSRFFSSWRLCEELSQKEFAKLLGISPANLCDIEKGRKGISIAKAAEIAEIIGIPPTCLVELALQEQVNSSGLDFAVAVTTRAA